MPSNEKQAAPKGSLRLCLAYMPTDLAAAERHIVVAD